MSPALLRALRALRDAPPTGVREAVERASAELFGVPARLVEDPGGAPGLSAPTPGGALVWPGVDPTPEARELASAFAELVAPDLRRAGATGALGSAPMLLALAESTRDPVWVLDRGLKLAACNSAFVEFMREAFALGPVLGEGLDGLPEPHRTRHERLYRRVLAKGPLRVDWTTPDRSRVFDVSLHPIGSRGADGSHEGVAVYCRDVTESRRQAGLLQRATDEAVRADRAKSEFLAQMSHEIRTPLNAILGLTELALDEPLPPTPRGYLEKIRNNSASLLHLVSGVLDFTRIEAGRLELDEAPMDLAQTVREVVDFHAHRAARKRLALELTVASDLPARVIGDAARVRQVVVNLLDNALKYTPAGRVDVSLDHRPPPPGDAEGPHRVLLAVRDTGLGVPAAEQEKIFRQFHRIEGQARESGAGLGLAITRALVERMGGRVDVESEVGRGSVFTVTLPMRIVRWTPAGEPARKPTLRRSLSILVVDDSPDNRAVTTALLGRVGHRVVAVGDGLSAVEAVGGQPFDLVLMDVHMPGIDGLEAARRIRASGSDVPILALTAHAMPEVHAACLEAGMNGWITKPVRAATLEEEVLRHARPARVLAVDDAPDARLLYRLWLSRAGARVDVAADAQEALQIMKNAHFDVVLLDHELPDLDGPELARQLRLTGYGGPIVVVTGHEDPDRRPGWDGLAAEILVKPITGERLAELVGQLSRPSR